MYFPRMETVYFAKWILLDTGEILLNGALSVQGNRISSLGPRSKVRKSSDDRIVNLGDVLLMPGLINMHTHLEESVVRGLQKDPDETFSAWSVKKNSRVHHASSELLDISIRLEIRELLSKGITSVVDSSRFDASEAVLKEESIRSWIIHELHEDGSQPERESVDSIIEKIGVFNTSIYIGIGPHAIFSLSPEIQKKLINFTNSTNRLWTSHLAESAEELQAFSERKGDLYFHVTRRKNWVYGDTKLGPVNYALETNLIPDNGILYHCNYINGGELEQLSTKNVFIVLCFLYTNMLGHKAFPIDSALNRNVTLCLGTEGIAAQGFMSLFDEMYAIKKSYPHIPASEILKWATVNPAKALRMQDKLGSLTPGKFADIIAVRFAHDPGEDILEELLVEEPETVLVIVNGEELMADY